MVISSQTVASSQGGLEERFSHLLQPIRDLAKNWDVDIAHFLEEYLDDLEKIEITFNDGATTMNFSEAALLIQGSAGVYAKKVEYLHSLVYQVLDLITQKKKARSAENGEGEEGECNNDEDDQFLPLDDIPDGDGAYFVEKDASTNKSIRVVPEMPTRLIPLEESEKGDNTLYNKKGEVMGNHSDFNIDTGFISTDGSILLELADRIFLRPTTPLARPPAVGPCITEEEDDGTDFALDTGVDTQAMDEVDGAETAGDVCGDNGDADLDDVPPEAAPVYSHGARSKRKVTFARTAATPKPKTDPWALLDPYETSKAVEKPLVKKKPFKIPAGLEDLATTKKRKIKKKIKQELPPLHEIVEKVFSHRSKFPKNPIKVPEFPELEDAFWEEFKLREAIKKEEIKMLKKEEREELIKQEQLDEDGEQEDAEIPLDDDNYGGAEIDDGGDDDIPQLQLDGDFFSQPGSLRRTTGEVDTGFQTGSCENLTLSYEDLVQRYVERFWASAAEFAQITDLSRRVAEWEEKIRPKLEEEESHETFDIHTYGTFVIQQCVRGQAVAFKDIVKGKKEYEICRYTLATLQLANVYNVELSLRPEKSGSIMDSLYVTLLSTKRHFEELEEYRAPSITDH